jgi:type IV pilus assembly protein PilC
VGELFFSYAVAGFSRTMATLLGSGIPIVESLRMALGTLGNRHLEQGMAVAIHQVEEGGRLSVALEQQQLMPSLALRMLGVGETTGSLEEMLSDIAEHLETQIEERVRLLTTAIEPAVMVVMGLIIGLIIVAMYLPIFKLAGTVG